MNIMDSKLIKFTYINNPKFIELTNEEKERFEFRYHLIHERMPFIRNLSIYINKVINIGLINLIKENREGFINQLYVDFVENLIINVSGHRLRDRKSSYRDGFIFSNEDHYYKMLNLFIDYYEIFRPQELDSKVFSNYYKYDYNKDFVELWYIYHDLYTNHKEDCFYLDIIKNLLVYFISHNELINEKGLYEEIIKSLFNNQSLLDYYRMNYKKREKEIPKDLIIRYRENNKIIT